MRHLARLTARTIFVSAFACLVALALWSARGGAATTAAVNSADEGASTASGVATLASLNGTHSGPRASSTVVPNDRPTIFKLDQTRGVNPSLLPAGGSATFSTVIRVNPYAANWTTAGDLLTVGFLREIAGETRDGNTPFTPAHDGDPVIWFQNNNPEGVGFCLDKQFFVNNNFVFTQSGVQQCGLPQDNTTQTAPAPGSLVKYSVAVFADNTYRLTIEHLDANGSRLTNLASLAPAANPYVITGTLPHAADSNYFPYVRFRVGRDTGGNGIANPDTNWEIQITDSQLDGIPDPAVVYVDDNWAGTSPGTDPDGAGPATSFGYDAFATIQTGVGGVATGGTVNVLAGTYDEDVNVNKTLSLLGAGAGTTNIRGPVDGPGTTVQISANNVTVAGFTVTRLGNNTTDWNNPGLNTPGFAIQGLSITGAVIRDNVITGNRTGIDINNSGGHTIRNNVIDFNRTGLIFRNQTDQMTVVENFITNNWTVGVLFLDASGGSNVPVQTARHSTFSNNNISANWYGQIVDRQSGGSLPAPATTNYKNFRGNWYGTTSPVITTANSAEPGYAAQIPVAYGGTATPPGGQPDIAGPASANFQITPFLLSGTDTNVETTPGRGTFGFQGVPNTVLVSPANQNGWVFADDLPGTGTGSGGFEAGPATPPLGVGSAFLTVDAEGRHILATGGYGGTRMDDLHSLVYGSYQDNNASTTVAPSLQFDIDYDLNDAATAFAGRLVFEPYLAPAQGAVQQNLWQAWDARAGNWYGTRTTVTVGNVAGVAQPCQPASPCTWQQVLTLFPNAGVRNTPVSAVLFKVGGPWPPGFDGNVDAFRLSVNAAIITYDFDPSPDTTAPTVQTITRAGTDPVAAGSSVQFTVTFSEPVTGVDATDFDVTTTGSIGGASVTGVSPASGPAQTYTVTVSTGSGTGTVRLDVDDDDSIKDAAGNPLGGAGADNGDFNTGETYTVQPTLTVTDVARAEGNSGTTTFTFTVQLSAAAQTAVTFDIATADNTATDADNDYEPKSLTGQSLPAGQTAYQFDVEVNGDAAQEDNETFFVNVTNVTGATVADAQGTGTILNDDGAPSAGQIVISEFRQRGPAPSQSPVPPAAGNEAGQLDEFIELYNNTDSDFVVADVSPLGLGSDGWAIFSSDDPTTPKYVIPAGTTIPARGHFLVTNRLGYSLADYAAPDTVAGPSASPTPASYEADIPDGAGLALFRTGSPVVASTVDLLDRVGFAPSSGTVPLAFSEGVPLQPPGGVTTPVEHSFLRRLSSGRPADSDDNAADFQFVTTDGGVYNGAQSVLGAPGPQNTLSPLQRNTTIKASLIDPMVSYGEAPNSVRRQCEDAGVEECDPARSARGTFSIRRRWTNNTGADVKQLRFRLVNITTGPTPPAGTADLRGLSSGQVTGVTITGGGTVDVQGTALEAPTQPLGGGLNSTLAAGTITAATPLAPGQSISVQFLLGVQQPGAYRFFVNVEAVTEAQQPTNAPSKAGAAPQKKEGVGKGVAGRP